MRKTKYLLVGGGSGGHIMPLIPVAEQIKSKDTESVVAFIGQRKDRFSKMLNSSTAIDEHYSVYAGKFRRYHDQKLLAKIFDIKTLFFNIRDFFLFIIGILQSLIILMKIKPQVIFSKGGYVCAPVGIAGHILRIPIITHDSDAMVSLAHRIIAKKAKLHLTAWPKELYTKYDQNKVFQVGIPVRKEYKQSYAKESLKKELGYDNTDKIVLIMGGGLGSKYINDSIIQIAKSLFYKIPKLKIINITGHKLYQDTVIRYSEALGEQAKQVRLIDFTEELYKFVVISDIVVTRAGATNLAELASLSKACIIIPSPFLAGGHQLENAKYLESRDAGIIVSESENKQQLQDSISDLLSDEKLINTLGINLNSAFLKNAESEIAGYLINEARNLDNINRKS